MEPKRQIVWNYLQETKLLETCHSHQCRRYFITGQDKADMLQDLYEWVLTYDLSKLWNAYKNKHLNALITAVLQRNLYSKTSPFYRTYRKFPSFSTDIEDFKNSLYTDED